MDGISPGRSRRPSARTAWIRTVAMGEVSASRTGASELSETGRASAAARIATTSASCSVPGGAVSASPHAVTSTAIATRAAIVPLCMAARCAGVLETRHAPPIIREGPVNSLADTPFRTLLEEALESWGFTRAGVIAEARSIDEEQWEFRPAKGARSVAELVHHIVESGLMAIGELTSADGDFTRQDYSAFLEEHAGHVAKETGRDRLIDLLEETHAEGDRRFRDVGELFMLQAIRRFDGQPGTRMAWLWHAIDHESYHRGQLAMYVRLTGKTPALTRMIRGES